MRNIFLHFTLYVNERDKPQYIEVLVIPAPLCSSLPTQSLEVDLGKVNFDTIKNIISAILV